jgi:hypothetical protein
MNRKRCSNSGDETWLLEGKWYRRFGRAEFRKCGQGEQFDVE